MITRQEWDEAARQHRAVVSENDTLRLEVQRLRNQLSAHADALVDIADLPDMSDIRRALRDQAQVIRASASA